MDGANADSDHSMTWEDFFGSTTDLTPTLIGIYDSLLQPAKSLRPVANSLETAKDARNDPPVAENVKNIMNVEPVEDIKDLPSSPPKDPSKMAGSVKLPIPTINKSSLYSIRTLSDKNGASDEIVKSDVIASEKLITSDKDFKVQRTLKDFKSVSESTKFDNLSPNVKRMISSATETTGLKFQKKSTTFGRASTRHKSNIPLFGATSKISQSGVEILPSVEIYDRPSPINTSFGNIRPENKIASPKVLVTPAPDFKINDDQATYDVPTNNRPAIYDVPNTINKTAFESLSLPYIDQSLELSISSNDREFDTKIPSGNNSPQKPLEQSIQDGSHVKVMHNDGTNSLHRKDLFTKNDSPSKLLSKAGQYPESVASTGNLKTCATDKEGLKLNPPIVEVTRPLSMSSITSSSSTSSSGVQNKGVNSAYLASIESLDDHSDADMTSANSSNNFVNSTGMLKSVVSEDRHLENIRHQSLDEVSGMSQLERVCAEIVQTENVYVEDLRQVVEGYLHEWRRDSTFSEEELSELFNNIEDIYSFNKSLCGELNTCQLDATCMARCFVNNTSGFSVYTSYCTGYPRTMERLAALASVPESARQFRERQLALGHLLPLASYLLKPVQRILKYHLLLQNVVKECASRETEYALLKMTGIAQHIDEMKRRHEHAVRVQEIQSLLYGWSGPDLTTYGELCAEGTFRVFGAKAMRHVFLFDKMLLVTKNREDGILAYKSHIMCNNMMLVESISGAPLSFHVIPWDAPRAQLTLQARSTRHKREWTLLLKRVILENYNAVIPSHARQLVMELGQNKTDDDMLAEKSHNLITQASMRKQLSAPEYLEKRKIERDRRKSFENGARERHKKISHETKVHNSKTELNPMCDCAQFSLDKGIDYTCDNCYVDLCSDCDTEINNKSKTEDICTCMVEENRVADDKCNVCEIIQYKNGKSIDNLERTQYECKCRDFKSSHESFNKEFSGSLNKSRGYHSSDNITGYTNNTNIKDDDTNNSLTNVRKIPKTCLKCAKIKENIVSDTSKTTQLRKSRTKDNDSQKTDSFRSKSREDPQRSKFAKIGTWRRKSEPGLQRNVPILPNKFHDVDNDRRGFEKIEFECRNCGSNKISNKSKVSDDLSVDDSDLDYKKRWGINVKQNVEIKMYNTKHVPKKISKIKKNRAKNTRYASDTSAKFYTDFSTDISTENILHISESNDSLHIDKPTDITKSLPIPATISKDEDIDEETYKKLIEKTDSFKKNELEKVKFLNKEKVINENPETEDLFCQDEIRAGDISCNVEAQEQPLEQIISQLLMQNREFQKLLKKQQQRSINHKRHQRLLKSHSTPDPVIIGKNMENTKLKPKYVKQISENLNITNNSAQEFKQSAEQKITEDEHIYETLRVENNIKDNDILDSKHKSISATISNPRRTSLCFVENDDTINKHVILESDYVYLSFDQLDKLSYSNDAIYDVPTKHPQKVDVIKNNDYYETMENNGPATSEINENIYDTLVEVCKRKKDVSDSLPGDYLPMSTDQQNPNTPEIWLSRQKEHFNVSRDRKSGSLPRSFQVVTNSPEDTDLSSFKCKPNSNSKTYLNREGKVMSTDRPFTIASDKSDISYDDVENYLTDNDIPRFNKQIINDSDTAQNISKSTLELEEAIDRCYKNNFEDVTIHSDKNENLLNISEPNLNTSMTSSNEGLSPERTEDQVKDSNIIHPEHKIYKPTSNILSIRNVLSRFKSRSQNKTTEDFSITDRHCNVDLKNNTVNEKRAVLNPRSYSKNLLQRFKNIISDEHSDESQKHSLECLTKTNLESDSTHTINPEIKAIIATDVNISNLTVDTINSELLSKSVCEQITASDHQNIKNNLETLSHSCDSIVHNAGLIRPVFGKSVSVRANSLSSSSSPLKAINAHTQILKKYPVYMQGSKHLGARIAQSDYVDPSTLAVEKSELKNINILINKNAVRPDSLFSNSSFVTTSSDSTCQEQQKSNCEIKKDEKISSKLNKKSSDVLLNLNSDESFYERSFEKIEQMTDQDVFRDSAVYSDQEDVDDVNIKKSDVIMQGKQLESSSYRFNVNMYSKNICASISSQSKEVKFESPNKVLEPQKCVINHDRILKPKLAPPVPMKPRISNIVPGNTSKMSTKEEVNLEMKINSENKPLVEKPLSNMKSKLELAHREGEALVETQNGILTNLEKNDQVVEIDTEVKHELTPNNIQIKRLSFERASLDSATRKSKTFNDSKIFGESSVVTKSVLERRLEIESLSKVQINTPIVKTKKPSNFTRPKSITTKVATYERSMSENGKKDPVNAKHSSIDSENIPTTASSIKDTRVESNCVNDAKASWVKQVVNKFQ